MIKILGMFITFIFGLQSLALAAKSDEMAVIDGKQYQLYVDAQAGIIISKSCHKKNNKYNCDAFKALKKASFKNVNITGGANPGAVMCRPLGGQVVLARDEKKNETTYCQFPDGSLIANGSITFHARQNDH